MSKIRWKYVIDREYAEYVASLRGEGKLELRSHRTFATSPEYEVIGVMGEIAFSQFSCYPLDASQRMSGDGGIDFSINHYTIDVKTAKKAYNLLVEHDKVKAGIYVLAQVISPAEVELVGWEYGESMLNAPLDGGEKFKNGVVNHYLSKEKLHSMGSLRTKLAYNRNN